MCTPSETKRQFSADTQNDTQRKNQRLARNCDFVVTIRYHYRKNGAQSRN